MVVLENNRNGRTKCYSTSAAALNGPKPKNQTPVKVVAPPPVESTVVEEPSPSPSPTSEVKVVDATETNGESQQTNGLPSPTPTILEEPEAAETSSIILGSDSSAPTLPDTISAMCTGVGCKKALSNTPHFQRNETSI